jgi:hypothetical protein
MPKSMRFAYCLGSVNQGADCTAIPTLEEHDSHFVVRCGLDQSRFREILSSVISTSILLVGVSDAEDTDPFTVIALVSLPRPIDPHNIVARLGPREMILLVPKTLDAQTPLDR